MTNIDLNQESRLQRTLNRDLPTTAVILQKARMGRVEKSPPAELPAAVEMQK
jgi:hypothetical protein